MKEYNYSLRVKDLCEDSNVYCFKSMKDLNKGIRVILAHESAYDFSDYLGGFYGQVNELLKENEIDFIYKQDYSKEPTNKEIFVDL